MKLFWKFSLSFFRVNLVYQEHIQYHFCRPYSIYNFLQAIFKYLLWTWSISQMLNPKKCFSSNSLFCKIRILEMVTTLMISRILLQGMPIKWYINLKFASFEGKDIVIYMFICIYCKLNTKNLNQNKLPYYQIHFYQFLWYQLLHI